MFVVGKSGRLTRSTAHNERVDALVYLPIYKALKALIVNLVILEGGDNGSCRAGKNSFFHFLISNLKIIKQRAQRSLPQMTSKIKNAVKTANLYF
jgi:hypothetical protein